MQEEGYSMLCYLALRKKSLPNDFGVIKIPNNYKQGKEGKII
jgi:hypothetical protein